MNNNTNIKLTGAKAMTKRIISLAFSIILVVFGGIIIYIFRLNVPRHIVNVSTVLGTLGGAAFILAGFLLPLIIKWIKAFWQKKAGKVVLSLLLALVVAGLGIFSATLGTILKAESNKADTQTTLIVLGCQVRGTVPSKMLSGRIDAAFDYLSDNPKAVAILSGGQGADEDISEAECMKRELIKKGIDESRLFAEASSKNTDENIKNSLEIIEKNSFSKSVAIATSDYHQKRAEMICSRYGLEPHAVNAPTEAYLVPVFYTREVFGVLREYCKF